MFYFANKYEVVRGFAVLWMLFFQLLDMFCFEYDLYGQEWLRYVNWLPVFMVVVGFSLRLAFKKYGVKRFYVRVFKRGVWFVLLGFMCFGVFLAYVLDNRLGVGVYGGFMGRVLRYFGVHALFLYFCHFAVVRRLLLSLGLFKGFGFSSGLVLTVVSILGLVLMCWGLGGWVWRTAKHYFLFLKSFVPSISVTYWKPFSISSVACFTLLAVLQVHSSSFRFNNCT